MSKSREELMMEYNALLRMRAEVEKDLLKIPGVNMVSVGVKTTNGIAAEGFCFRIYVDKKKNISEIASNEIIPKEINGVRTDVHETAKNVRLSAKNIDEGKYRPMSGGIIIRPAKHKKNAGTLGCFAIDDDATSDDDKIVLLTCHHVLMRHGEKPGHQVAQPSFHCDWCCCRCGEVAQLVRGVGHDQNVDCAIAKLTNGNGNNWTNEVIELGPISCIPVDADKTPVDPFTGKTTLPDGTPYRPVLPHDPVFKRGATTRFTEGRVADIKDIKFPGENGLETLTTQIYIMPLTGQDPFADLGDSGSVILNHLNQVVGLLWATDTDNPPITYANPIQDVLKALHITIPDTGTLETLPLKALPDTSGIPKKDLADKAIEWIEQQPNGKLLIDLFKKHEEEILHLVNTDREVKLAWNRHHGPSFTAHLVEKIKDDTYRMPAEIQGISWQRLLSKMSVVLEKKGSREMANDIEKHASKIMLLIGKIIHSSNNEIALETMHGYA